MGRQEQFIRQNASRRALQAAREELSRKQEDFWNADSQMNLYERLRDKFNQRYEALERQEQISYEELEREKKRLQTEAGKSEDIEVGREELKGMTLPPVEMKQIEELFQQADGTQNSYQDFLEKKYSLSLYIFEALIRADHQKTLNHPQEAERMGEGERDLFTQYLEVRKKEKEAEEKAELRSNEQILQKLYEETVKNPDAVKHELRRELQISHIATALKDIKGLPSEKKEKAVHQINQWISQDDPRREKLDLNGENWKGKEKYVDSLLRKQAEQRWRQKLNDIEQLRRTTMNEITGLEPQDELDRKLKEVREQRSGLEQDLKKLAETHNKHAGRNYEVAEELRKKIEHEVAHKTENAFDGVHASIQERLEKEQKALKEVESSRNRMDFMLGIGMPLINVFTQYLEAAELGRLRARKSDVEQRLKDEREKNAKEARFQMAAAQGSGIRLTDIDSIQKGQQRQEESQKKLVQLNLEAQAQPELYEKEAYEIRSRYAEMRKRLSLIREGEKNGDELEAEKRIYAQVPNQGLLSGIQRTEELEQSSKEIHEYLKKYEIEEKDGQIRVDVTADKMQGIFQEENRQKLNTLIKYGEVIYQTLFKGEDSAESQTLEEMMNQLKEKLSSEKTDTVSMDYVNTALELAVQIREKAQPLLEQSLKDRNDIEDEYVRCKTIYEADQEQARKLEEFIKYGKEEKVTDRLETFYQQEHEVTKVKFELYKNYEAQAGQLAQEEVVRYSDLKQESENKLNLQQEMTAEAEKAYEDLREQNRKLTMSSIRAQKNTQPSPVVLQKEMLEQEGQNHTLQFLSQLTGTSLDGYSNTDELMQAFSSIYINGLNACDYFGLRDLYYENDRNEQLKEAIFNHTDQIRQALLAEYQPQPQLPSGAMPLVGQIIAVENDEFQLQPLELGTEDALLHSTEKNIERFNRRQKEQVKSLNEFRVEAAEYGLKKGSKEQHNALTEALHQSRELKKELPHKEKEKGSRYSAVRRM